MQSPGLEHGSRSMQDSSRCNHRHSTMQDPFKIHSRSIEDPFKIHQDAISIKIHSRSIRKVMTFGTVGHRIKLENTKQCREFAYTRQRPSFIELFLHCISIIRDSLCAVPRERSLQDGLTFTFDNTVCRVMASCRQQHLLYYSGKQKTLQQLSGAPQASRNQ
jgi:hypothetical protein